MSEGEVECSQMKYHFCSSLHLIVSIIVWCRVTKETKSVTIHNGTRLHHSSYFVLCVVAAGKAGKHIECDVQGCQCGFTIRIMLQCKNNYNVREINTTMSIRCVLLTWMGSGTHWGTPL